MIDLSTKSSFAIELFGRHGCRKAVRSLQCCVQASERSEKLESEATAMEGQYASAYAGARQTYTQGRARLDAIQAVSTPLQSCDKQKSSCPTS